MKKVLLRGLIIILCVLCADKIIGVISKALLQNMPNAGSLYSNVNHALLKSKPDVLILGSSRANHSYVPSVLSDSLGLTCYNAGVDGHGMVMSYSIYKSICERKKPKIVLLDMWYTQWHDTHMDDMRSFYDVSTGVKEVIDSLNDWRESSKMKFSLYKYNGTIDRIIKCYINGDVNSDGYLPLNNTPNKDNIVTINRDDLEYNDLSWSLLQKIIDDCADNNIKFVMVFSPTLIVQDNEFMQKVEGIANKNKIPYLNYNKNDYYLSHPELFKDLKHMNDNGARVFSKEIASELLQL